jgi:PKHD-type hydroxylase
MTYSDPFIDHYSEKEYDFMNFYVFENMFTDEEIEIIKEYGNNLEMRDGKVNGGANDLNTTVRKSEIGFFGVDENTQWIFDRIAQHVLIANEEMWGFDLIGFGDSIQFTKYYEDGGHYDWHADIGSTVPHRKISIVVQLSEENEYEGGNLQFNIGPYYPQAPKTKGTGVIFPTYMLHRVTPVTEGTRMSLVSWISGPNFK